MTKDDEIFQHVKHEPALKIPLILKILEIPDISKTPIIPMVQKYFTFLIIIPNLL